MGVCERGVGGDLGGGGGYAEKEALSFGCEGGWAWTAPDPFWPRTCAMAAWVSSRTNPAPFRPAASSMQARPTGDVRGEGGHSWPVCAPKNIIDSLLPRESCGHISQQLHLIACITKGTSLPYGHATLCAARSLNQECAAQRSATWLLPTRQPLKREEYWSTVSRLAHTVWARLGADCGVPN